MDVVCLYEQSTDCFSDPDTTYMAQGTSADYIELDGEDNTTALRAGKIAKVSSCISFLWRMNSEPSLY